MLDFVPGSVAQPHNSQGKDQMKNPITMTRSVVGSQVSQEEPEE